MSFQLSSARFITEKVEIITPNVLIKCVVYVVYTVGIMKTYLLISNILIIIFSFIPMYGIFTANRSLNVGLLLVMILGIINTVVVAKQKK
ncbi:hypothetical protein KA078_02110 [Candidatus Woesebacteria bacterium]|nr:hypothetical protein [Candidatus Woesebacteria bacterium]